MLAKNQTFVCCARFRLCGLETKARLGMYEEDVHAALVLQLGDLRLVQLTILRILKLFGVVDEQLAKLLLLHGFAETLQLVLGEIQVGEFVRGGRHVLLRACVLE